MSRLSFDEALELVPDDLPDGAYWAMAHEMAGLEYGDGFPSFSAPQPKRLPKTGRKHLLRTAPRTEGKPHRCGTCGKDFATKGAKKRHRADVHKPVAIATGEPK